MAPPPYSNGNTAHHAFGVNHHKPKYQNHPNHHHKYYDDGISVAEELLAGLVSWSRLLWAFAKGRGRRMAANMALRFLHRLRRNLAVRRLLNFPHLLVCLWLVVLLWGERWVFEAKVESCRWEDWQNWPPGATPHHLVFVADPQLIDPHSYPGRPWPLSALTVLVTDNYLRRGYNQLQRQLKPDSVFFLGDLFDGGREWKTAHGDFNDAEWARGHRPASEQRHVRSWNRKYGEDYWLREYARFGDIFVKPWYASSIAAAAAEAEAEAETGSASGAGAGAGPTTSRQRGRKLVASLPGNHDLGFGAEVKVAVRDRFTAYFGEGNRVDVVGNHTVVSVDTVSLSAGTADEAARVDLKHLYLPADIFLHEVRATKRRAVERELRFWSGDIEAPRFAHRVEDLDDDADTDAADGADRAGAIDPGGGGGGADFPTILLTHVPLYRSPGTPCGPQREHWPPAKPARGQTGPVVPDHANAITVARGYQYQNVLSQEDSAKLVERVGNVVHAFSGDDHDYCEVVHSVAGGGRVREITVKSMSMAMGVPTPGFLMVSLYNPVGPDGRPLPGAPETTLQTHLCLLPSQLSTYARYAALVLVTLAVLALRALLVPVLRLRPFALEPDAGVGGGRPESYLLPVFKDKVEDGVGGGVGGGGGDAHPPRRGHGSSSSGSSASRHLLASRFGSSSSSSSSSTPAAAGPRTRSPSTGTVGNGAKPSRVGSGAKWGWGRSQARSAPKIEIASDDFYDGGKSRSGSLSTSFQWRPAPAAPGRSRGAVAVVVRELWTTVWRVAWMVVLFWSYLAYKG